MHTFKPRSFTVLFAICLAVMVLFAACMMAYDMRSGPWAFSDSVAYIASAESLVREARLGIYSPDGSFMPLSLHPPMYSLLLAPFVALNLDIFDVIKWMNVLLFSGSVVMISLAIYRFTRDALYALAAGSVFMFSTAVVKVYDGAMSEALFVFLTLANLMLLVAYLLKPSIWTFLGAAVIGGMAAVTRYIGMVSIGLGFVLLLLFAAKPWKKKIFCAVGYAVLSALPLAIWFISTGSTGSRSLNTNMDILSATLEYKKAIMETFVSWLPFCNDWFKTWDIRAAAVITVLLFTLILLAVVVWKWFRTGTEKNRGMIFVLCGSAVYILGFLQFLWVSLFSSIQPDYFERMFTPTQPMIYILFLGVIIAAIKLFKLSPIFYVVPIAAAVILGRSNWINTHVTIQVRHTNPMGYAISAWRNSDLISEVETLPWETVLYSNNPDGVLLYTRRFPYELSEMQAEALTPASGESGIDELSDTPFTAVIIFTSPLTKVEAGTERKVVERLGVDLDGVEPYASALDGEIYLFASSGAE